MTPRAETASAPRSFLDLPLFAARFEGPLRKLRAAGDAFVNRRLFSIRAVAAHLNARYVSGELPDDCVASWQTIQRLDDRLAELLAWSFGRPVTLFESTDAVSFLGDDGRAAWRLACEFLEEFDRQVEAGRAAAERA